MSKDKISSPQPTGEWISLPFYPGCRYVAFPAKGSNEVRIYLSCSKVTLYIYKVSTVDIYQSRPESLVYHEYIFPVMDLKGISPQMCQCRNLQFGEVDEILTQLKLCWPALQSSQTSCDNDEVISISFNIKFRFFWIQNRYLDISILTLIKWNK